MKAVIAIAVLACFLAVASAQNPFTCGTRAGELATCVSRLGTASQDGVTAFCNECGNSLVSYYRDCLGGAGVAQVQQRKPKAISDDALHLLLHKMGVRYV